MFVIISSQCKIYDDLTFLTISADLTDSKSKCKIKVNIRKYCSPVNLFHIWMIADIHFKFYRTAIIFNDSFWA